MPRFRLRTLLILLAIGLPVLAWAWVAYFDPDSALRGLLVCLLFASVAALTRCFATRPRLLVRFFGARDVLRDAVRMVRDPNYTQSMRLMSNLQFAFSLWVGMTAAVLTCLGIAHW